MESSVCRAGRALLWLVTLSLPCAVGFAAGAGETSAPAQKALVQPYSDALPIVQDKVTLRFLTHTGTSASFKPASNDLPVYQYYEKITNVHIEWENIQYQNYVETLRARLAAGFAGSQAPDIINFSGLNNQLMDAAADRIIIEQDALVEKYAPNITKFWKTDPINKFGNIAPDGHIYGVGGKGIDVFSLHILINQIWLDKLGIRSKPATIDEMYQVLLRFRDGDPNGNKLADEIPLAGSPGTLSVIGDAYGLRGMTYHEGWQADDGKVSWNYADPRYKSYLASMNRLYRENLLDKAFLTAGSNQWFEYAKSDKAGVICYYANFAMVFTSMHPASDPAATIPVYVPSTPLKGPEGNQSITLRSMGPFDPMAISTQCKYPEVAMRYIDFLRNSKEAMTAQDYGLEGVTYDMVDGKIKQRSFPEGFSIKLEGIGGRFPPYASVQTQNGYLVRWPSWLPEAVLPLHKFNVDGFPYIAPNKQENDQIKSIWADLGTYVNEMRAKFITGQESLDKWDEYMSNLKRLRADELIELKRKQYSRYQDFLRTLK